MNKIKHLVDLIFNGELHSTKNVLEDILSEKVKLKLEEKKKEIAQGFIEEDKNPKRIKHAQAEQILRNSGYVKIRSGEHQSIWRHSSDKSKKDFPLPHHTRELSPGVTRGIFSLATEEVMFDVLSSNTIFCESLEGFVLKRHRLGIRENKHKSAKVYSSPTTDKHQVHYYSGKKKIDIQHFDDFNDADEDASIYVKN